MRHIRRRIAIAAASCGLLSWLAVREPPPGAPGPGRAGPEVGERGLGDVLLENGCLAPPVAMAAGHPASWPDWREASIAGGDVQPARVVSDPYPILHSVAVDPQHDRVFVSDPNLHALWSYERGAASEHGEAVTPLTGIRGPATGMMFVANLTLDPDRREIYSVDNDIGDRMMVFPYDADGNVRPQRVLHVPHQAWGLSINHQRDEIAVTVESSRMVVIYRREASLDEQPLRVIRGPRTGLGDPRGVFFDGTNDEIVVVNHGNQGGRETAPGDAPLRSRGPAVGGRFDPPSITVYPGGAAGDVEPIRRIAGEKTGLDWPMAIAVDLAHDEMAVANNGDSSVRWFRRTDTGDAAPVRVLKGPGTGIAGPMGVAIDLENDELWVSNYGDHTALVFDRTAAGDVAPRRILRNAPEGSATVGFGNPGAVAFDTKRGEILVPN